MSSTRPMAKKIARGNSPSGVAQGTDVHGVHLHAGVRQEVVDDEHQARQPGPDGEQMVGVHRRRRRVALPEEDDTEGHQDHAGNQGADDEPAAGEAGNALGAARGHPDAGPVDDDDDKGRPHTTGGELRVDHVRQGARHELEQARVVEDGHCELAPHREEAHRLGDPAGYPVVDVGHTPRPARPRPTTWAAGTRSPARGRGTRRPCRRAPWWGRSQARDGAGGHQGQCDPGDVCPGGYLGPRSASAGTSGWSADASAVLMSPTAHRCSSTWTRDKAASRSLLGGVAGRPTRQWFCAAEGPASPVSGDQPAPADHSTMCSPWLVLLRRRTPSSVTVTMSSMRTPNRPAR